jgi:hypothetical protein
MATTDKLINNLTGITSLLDTDVIWIARLSTGVDCIIPVANLKTSLGIQPNNVLPCLAPVSPETSVTTTIVLGTVLAFHSCTIDCTFTRGTGRIRKQLIEVSNLGGHVIFAPGGYTTYPASTDETLETTGITLNARLLSGSIVFEITVDNSDANDVSLNYKYLNYY